MLSSKRNTRRVGGLCDGRGQIRKSGSPLGVPIEINVPVQTSRPAVTSHSSLLGIRRRGGLCGGRGQRESYSDSHSTTCGAVVDSLDTADATDQPLPQNNTVTKKRRNRHDQIWGSIDILTAPDLLYVGLTYVHFDKMRQSTVKHKENINRFIEHYGVPPSAVVPFFIDLKAKHPEIAYKEALMTMNWLKEYRTERAMSGTWGFGCVKHIRDTVKYYVEKMASLSETKIVFGGFDPNENICFSVDNVHFMTNEFRLDPSAKWFDFKSRSAGDCYEVAVAIRRPAIVSIRGPFPASVHDITIFRGGKTDEKKELWDKDSLYFKMETESMKGKRGVGDSAYAGEPDKIITTNNFHSAEMKEFLARVKNRGESVFVRFKAFNILRNRFRHGSGTENKLALHGFCFRTIAVIVQYDFENERPLFQVS